MVPLETSAPWASTPTSTSPQVSWLKRYSIVHQVCSIQAASLAAWTHSSRYWKFALCFRPPFKHLWASSCSNFSGWFAQWLTTVLHVGFCLSNVSVFIVLTCRKIFTDTMPGEGGMVLCDDPDLAERSRVLWQDRSSNWIDGSQVMNICGPFVHLLQLAGANNFVTCALIRRSGVLCMRPRAAGLEDIASTWKHQHLSCGSFRSWDGTIAWPICRLGQKA